MSDKTFTHKTAENAKPGDKPCKLSTGKGFYLLIMPTGGSSGATITDWTGSEELPRLVPSLMFP